MLEIVLSSFAGMATAIAIKKIPKKRPVATREVNSIVKSQIDSLKIERELLTKTISRLYQHNENLTNIQRDRLLMRYQHQLNYISKKIEQLETSKSQDWDAVGEGLITLVDQKLSHIDNRLDELSSKITNIQPNLPKSKPIQENKVPKDEKQQIRKEPPKQVPIPKIPLQDIEIDEKPKQPIELITLTSLPKKPINFPLLQKEKDGSKSKIQSTITSLGSAKIILLKEKTEQKTTQEEDIDDSDDLEKIKGEILKTLSKLDEAEVE